MARRIYRTAQARRDYKEIFAYIAADNPTAAAVLLRSFDKTLELILTSPEMGRIHPELGEDVRLFLVKTYLLVYCEVQNGIRVLAVIHGARDIPSVFNNL
jgi:toxin ParE1/3/4